MSEQFKKNIEKIVDDKDKAKSIGDKFQAVSQEIDNRLFLTSDEKENELKEARTYLDTMVTEIEGGLNENMTLDSSFKQEKSMMVDQLDQDLTGMIENLGLIDPEKFKAIKGTFEYIENNAKGAGFNSLFKNNSLDKYAVSYLKLNNSEKTEVDFSILRESFEELFILTSDSEILRSYLKSNQSKLVQAVGLFCNGNTEKAIKEISELTEKVSKIKEINDVNSEFVKAGISNLKFENLDRMRIFFDSMNISFEEGVAKILKLTKYIDSNLSKRIFNFPFLSRKLKESGISEISTFDDLGIPPDILTEILLGLLVMDEEGGEYKKLAKVTFEIKARHYLTMSVLKNKIKTTSQKLEWTTKKLHSAQIKAASRGEATNQNIIRIENNLSVLGLNLAAYQTQIGSSELKLFYANSYVDSKFSNNEEVDLNVIDEIMSSSTYLESKEIKKKYNLPDSVLEKRLVVKMSAEMAARADGVFIRTVDDLLEGGYERAEELYDDFLKNGEFTTMTQKNLFVTELRKEMDGLVDASNLLNDELTEEIEFFNSLPDSISEVDENDRHSTSERVQNLMYMLTQQYQNTEKLIRLRTLLDLMGIDNPYDSDTGERVRYYEADEMVFKAGEETIDSGTISSYLSGSIEDWKEQGSEIKNDLVSCSYFLDSTENEEERVTKSKEFSELLTGDIDSPASHPLYGPIIRNQISEPLEAIDGQVEEIKTAFNELSSIPAMFKAYESDKKARDFYDAFGGPVFIFNEGLDSFDNMISALEGAVKTVRRTKTKLTEMKSPDNPLFDKYPQLQPIFEQYVDDTLVELDRLLNAESVMSKSSGFASPFSRASLEDVKNARSEFSAAREEFIDDAFYRGVALSIIIAVAVGFAMFGGWAFAGLGKAMIGGAALEAGIVTTGQTIFLSGMTMGGMSIFGTVGSRVGQEMTDAIGLTDFGDKIDWSLEGLAMDSGKSFLLMVATAGLARGGLSLLTKGASASENALIQSVSSRGLSGVNFLRTVANPSLLFLRPQAALSAMGPVTAREVVKNGSVRYGIEVSEEMMQTIGEASVNPYFAFFMGILAAADGGPNLELSKVGMAMNQAGINVENGMLTYADLNPETFLQNLNSLPGLANSDVEATINYDQSISIDIVDPSNINRSATITIFPSVENVEPLTQVAHHNLVHEDESGILFYDNAMTSESIISDLKNSGFIDVEVNIDGSISAFKSGEQITIENRAISIDEDLTIEEVQSSSVYLRVMNKISSIKDSKPEIFSKIDTLMSNFYIKHGSAAFLSLICFFDTNLAYAQSSQEVAESGDGVVPFFNIFKLLPPELMITSGVWADAAKLTIYIGLTFLGKKIATWYTQRPGFKSKSKKQLEKEKRNMRDVLNRLGSVDAYEVEANNLPDIMAKLVNEDKFAFISNDQGDLVIKNEHGEEFMISNDLIEISKNIDALKDSGSKLRERIDRVTTHPQHAEYVKKVVKSINKVTEAARIYVDAILDSNTANLKGKHDNLVHAADEFQSLMKADVRDEISFINKLIIDENIESAFNYAMSGIGLVGLAVSIAYHSYKINEQEDEEEKKKKEDAAKKVKEKTQQEEIELNEREKELLEKVNSPDAENGADGTKNSDSPQPNKTEDAPKPEDPPEEIQFEHPNPDHVEDIDLE